MNSKTNGRSRITYSMGLVVAISLFLAGHAGADVLTFTMNYGTPMGGPDTTLSLPDFDTTLGTLNGVTLTVTSDFSLYGTIDNIAPYDTPFLSDTTIMQVFVATPDNPVIETQGVALYGSGTVYSGPRVLFEPTKDIDGVANEVVLDAGFFPDYESVGAQTFNFTVSTPPGSFVGGRISPNPLVFGGGGSSSGVVEVDYDYTAVPEPSTCVMLAGGLGLLFAFRRRR